MADHCCQPEHYKQGMASQVSSIAAVAGDAHQVHEAASASTCCSGGVPVFDGMNQRYKRILWLVIAINAAMFVTEIIGGQLAGSQALKADALDFLADTVTYGLSLAVIGTTIRTRALAAMMKGLSLTLMAAWVLSSTIYHVLLLGLPRAEIMGGIGLIALAVNAASVLLLLRYKNGDANVRSVWLCSRNDMIGNIIVMVAAAAVWGAKTAWPDLLVAAIMAGLFLISAIQILGQAWAEYHGNEAHTNSHPVSDQVSHLMFRLGRRKRVSGVG